MEGIRPRSLAFKSAVFLSIFFCAYAFVALLLEPYAGDYVFEPWFLPLALGSLAYGWNPGRINHEVDLGQRGELVASFCINNLLLISIDYPWQSC